MVTYLSTADGVRFDLNDDGQTEVTPWVAPHDGLLAYDHNQDGVINEGREIVFTSWGTDETVETDLQALGRYFDSNQDGALDNTDATWQQFGVWQDADSDGQSDPGEFRTLDELGIASIDLQGDGVSSTAADGDVLIHGTTEVTYADGSTTIAQDITFSALLDQALADPALLSDVPPEPLAGAAAPADTADLTALVDAFVASEPITEVPPVQDLPSDDTTLSIDDPSQQTDGSESLSDPLLADAVSDDGTDLPAPDPGHSVHTSL